MQRKGLYNLLIVLFSAIGSITYGYCSAIIGTTLAQPTFQSYFALDTRSNAAQLNGAINGVFQAGGFLGTFVCGWTSDKWGRRIAIVIASCAVIIGAAIQAGSVQIAMFIVGRLITGLGIGSMVMLVPLYQSEISPASSRGLLVGLHGVFIMIGYTICNWVNIGFYFVHVDGRQWRIPVALQIMAPAILSAVIFKLPESPRWLVETGESDKALANLKKIHHDPNDITESFAVAEFQMIHQRLEADRAQPTSWRSLFTVKSYRKRSILGFMTMFCAQCTGTQVIGNFGPTIYSTLGYDSLQQMLLQAGYITWGPFGNLINALLLDRVGRKPLLVFGLTACGLVVMLEMIMVDLYTGTTNKAGNAAAVFFLYLHLGFFASCLDATTYVYTSEIWPTHIRSKGTALSTSGLFAGSLVFGTGAVKAFDTLSWRYYIIFIVLSIISAIAFALFIPETNGLPLEEIGKLFGDEVDGSLVLSASPQSDQVGSEKSPTVIDEAKVVA